MGLSIPSRKGVVDALRNYMRAELPELDTSTERRSLIGALIKSLGSALADFYIALKRWVDREPFPQTASEAGTLFTGWWQALTKLERNPASASRGFVAIPGTPGTVIPVDMTLLAGGVSYRTLEGGTIAAQQMIATTLAVSGQLAVFTTASDHYLATGMTVEVSGATPAAYNGTYTITVTYPRTFTYEPATIPGSPAVGTPQFLANYLAIEVQSNTKGIATNLDSGAVLSVVSAPSGASGSAYVTAPGVQGGTEIETADAYRARVLKALGTDYGMFTADEIEIIAKQVPGVTKVMIRKAMINPPEGWPLEGQVKIAFLRGNDLDIMPSAQEVTDVKARIMALAMPAHTAEEDVIVMSPVRYPVDFMFKTLSPNTPSMRRAVTASLQQFFLEKAEWGVAIEEIDYLCAIRDTIDLDARLPLKSFELFSPQGRIVPGVDDYAVVGTITFPVS